MDMKSYILVGGGLLICLVLLHAFVTAWRDNRRVATADSAAAEPDPLDTDVEVGESLWADAEAELTGEAVVEEGVASEGPIPPMLLDQTTDTASVADADADATIGSQPEDVVVEPSMLDPSPESEATNEPPSLDDGSETLRRGRRIDIPGKRTEPTVPRSMRTEVHTFTRPPEPPQPDPTEALEEVLIIWVVAKPGRQLDGEKLFKGFVTHGLTCDADRVFKKADPRCGGHWYTVANGVEPGTFDVSEPDALSTPGIVMLMGLMEVRDPGQAFEHMLDVAQDLAISLDAELKDEHRSDMSGQTIEHCRQRIRDFRRLALRA